MNANTGDLVRVVNRRGVSLVGELLDWWALGSGAVCVKVRPAVGGPPRVYAVDAVEVLARAASSGQGPTGPRRPPPPTTSGRPLPARRRLRPGPVRRAAG
jgi:hypothetical protein